MKKELNEVQQARRRRKRKIIKRRLIIFSLVLLSIGIVVFVVLLKTKLFPIKSVKVTGSSLYDSEQIISVSGIGEDTPIMGISRSKIENRLFKKLPYIETVKIERVFPDSVLLKVSDAKEYYAFKSNDKYYAVSKKNRVLKKYDELPEGLVEVVLKDSELKIGSEVDFKNSKVKELFEFLTSYPAKKNISVNKIDLTSTVHIVIGVQNRFEVNLGNETNLEEKINHLAGMIPEIGDRNGKINLDMWSNSDSKGTFIAEN